LLHTNYTRNVDLSINAVLRVT